MERKENLNEIVTLAFKAIGLAMAVAVIVLNFLKVQTAVEQIPLLAMGLFSIALASLTGKEYEVKDEDEH